VRWYLRFGLSYGDVEELLAERGIEVDHVTMFRWVHASRRSWSTRPDRAATRSATAGNVDETYMKVAGRWRYVYRAIDQHGQIIDISVSTRRDIEAARRFFTMAHALMANRSR